MKPKKVAIIQSNYIPWKGYFDIINSVDEFILLDDVQYTRRDWRNRNLIKTSNGLHWLSIPVQVKNNFTLPINKVEVADAKWGSGHWSTISQNYRKAPFYKDYEKLLAPLYLQPGEKTLSLINFSFLKTICDILEIKTAIRWSTDYPSAAGKNERLISLCQAVGASVYLSGPSAKGYLNEDTFRASGITVEWMDYGGYPEYPQLYPPFEHGVSILDLLFNTGGDARKFMKSF